MTRLVLQNPGSEPSLLTTLLGALDGGLSGGGIFAWTNRSGIAAVLESDAFASYIKKRPFQLVVGTDSITDEAALDRLIELAAQRPLLDLTMFVHDKNVIFHPKMAWVHTPAGLRLLVGSGNLTRSGLQASWEIFTDSLLTGAAATEAEKGLAEWREVNAAYMLDPSDPLVRLAVAQNLPNERTLRQRPKNAAKPAAKPAAAPPPISLGASGNSVLVTELPKNRKITREDSPDFGRSMFSQANFTKELFETYFGVENGKTELMLTPVAPDGSLGELETRLGKYKAVSRNYYFELAAAAGLAHPGDKAPIAAFVELDSGAYLYLFRLPGQTGFDELDELLANYPAPGGNRLRRQTLDLPTLKAAWPGCPLLIAPEPPL
jgi:hypothetical protein